MPKNKKFIDRKNAVTFHLVHRSQQDPLTADEKAPQRVLVPVQEKPKVEKDVEKRKEEQKKFGVFFDDDYNYLQHLRDTSTTVVWEKVEPVESTSKLKLPSSVFASVVEEDVGLLNKAAPHSGPRLDMDPDIVAAMDEDFDFTDPSNELEDNFMELANAEGSDEEGSDVDSDFAYSDEERDEVGSMDRDMFADEETKSRFTDYSISSSVMRRNAQLTLLDDRFEKLYTKAYDDNEIGPLDCEEIEGFVDPNSDILLQCADEFEKQQKREQLEKNAIGANIRLQEEENADEDNDDDIIKREFKDYKEKWDCESILSTYSNIYNHPKLISEPRMNPQKIKINMKTGMPENVLGTNKLTTKALSQFNADNTPDYKSNGPRSECAKSVISVLSTLSIRPKDETPEERKDRKKHLKEYRNLRRIEKKVNTQAFKEETKRQVKIAINNKNNVQGNRIL